MQSRDSTAWAPAGGPRRLSPGGRRTDHPIASRGTRSCSRSARFWRWPRRLRGGRLLLCAWLPGVVQLRELGSSRTNQTSNPVFSKRATRSSARGKVDLAYTRHTSISKFGTCIRHKRQFGPVAWVGRAFPMARANEPKTALAAEQSRPTRRT